jgi:integrase
LNSNELSAYLTPLIEPFFAKAQSFNDTRLTEFAASVGIEIASIKGVFAPELWGNLQTTWRLERDRLLATIIRLEMKELLQTAEHQSEFRAPRIISRIKQKHPDIKINIKDFERVARDEWREMVKTLPNAVEVAREKILARLQAHVDANTPLCELSHRRLYREAGIVANYGEWLAAPYRAARAELARRQRSEVAGPPTGSNIREIPGGWVDLDADVWKISPGRTLMRSALRPDIAEVAWPTLTDELKGEYALSTINTHYSAYHSVGRLLGSEVKDIRSSTLEAVQRAWAAGEGKVKSNEYALRAALVHLFSSLLALADEDPAINRSEMLKIVLWLCAKVKISKPHSKKNFLTASELDALLTCCVRDIESGFEFLSTNPQLLNLSTTKQAALNAQHVIHLSSALMILLMAITGIRPGSVKNLEVRDSMRIRPQLGALVWRHPKKREEHIALTPISVAILLEQYIYHTNEIRRALSTNHIFFSGDHYGGWTTIKYTTRINELIVDFVGRHNLTRDGVMLPLSPTTLRRTCATQQLYKGRSIWFVRAQFGHKSITTTASYVQLDRFEHPAQVRYALDAWGKRVLGLWETPVLLENIHPYNRAFIFSGTSSEKAKAVDASLLHTPGCSSCEHLVTGLEFVEEWEVERLQRERALLALMADPESKSLVREAKIEHQQFLDNYNRVKGEVARDDQ